MVPAAAADSRMCKGMITRSAPLRSSIESSFPSAESVCVLGRQVDAAAESFV